ncbi:Carboxylesterase [Penicillium angulare]|uniref:Carboxylic ester hydrolase n=1 Tax=Penicillium angulare TaxID=116970 RepID=A0A9W9K6L1_9EURO|nr:Carboxylesterase [Penicillium angulare]
MRSVYPLLIGTFVALGAQGAPSSTTGSDKNPIIRTSYGRLQGNISEYRDNVYAFKGIPFASPPTGEARWTPPTKPDSWDGIRKATVPGPQCPQPLIDGKGLWTTGSEVMSEDCLYLNIWTPTTDTSANLPVYIWMYGGRFVDGSGDVITYDGSGLAAQDIVMVTINYRLGPFGYLAHPELSAESPHNVSGNYGVMDMIAAVEWVKAEIANFGGNPEKITVGGQSSGSSCALDMFYSPQSSGLIAGVIAESGPRAPHDPITGSVATSYRKKEHALASGVDFVSNKLNVSSIAEARKIPTANMTTWSQLNDTIFDGTQFENVTNFSEPPLWRPVLDGYVLPYSYWEALLNNEHANVPILAGNNKDETGASPDPGYTVSTYRGNYTAMYGNLSTRYFELYPADTYYEANNQSNLMWQDFSRISTWQFALNMAAGGNKQPVWSYYWTHAPPGQDLGAFHGSEMYYVFNNIPYNYPDMPWTRDDYEVQTRMTAYWANFIKTGNPNGGSLTKWLPSKFGHQTMWLGDSWGSDTIGESSHVDLIADFFSYQTPY